MYPLCCFWISTAKANTILKLTCSHIPSSAQESGPAGRPWCQCGSAGPAIALCTADSLPTGLCPPSAKIVHHTFTIFIQLLLNNHLRVLFSHISFNFYLIIWSVHNWHVATQKKGLVCIFIQIISTCFLTFLRYSWLDTSMLSNNSSMRVIKFSAKNSWKKKKRYLI